MPRVARLLPSVVTLLVLAGPLVAVAQDHPPAIEDRAEAARLESINRLKGLLADLDDGRRPEMLLRLAELYVEEGRYLQQKGMAGYLVAKDRCFDTPGCDPATVVEADHVAESRAWFERSVKIYRQVLAGWPQFARADEASFYLGQALGELGRQDEAAAELTRMVKTYTDSRFAPQAWLLVGEHWFERDAPAKALVAYQRAASYRDGETSVYASYKLAWCYYNVGELDAAITTMTGVLDAGATQVSLQDEALKDLVRFFADKGDLAGADALFERYHKPELKRDVLARLAATYTEQGRHEQAVIAWRRIIASAPEHPDAPAVADRVVQAFLKMDRKEDALSEIAAFRKAYSPQGPWARANAVRPEAVAGAQAMLRTELRTVASAWHTEARKLPSGPGAARVYGLAERAYDTFLQDFPTAEGAVDMRYGYAELLYATGRPGLAFPQYMAVVAADPKGPHARFCAESAIFAAEKMVEGDTAPAGIEAVPLTEWDQNALAALDQYAALYDGPKTQAVLYKSAWLLYHRNHFREAAERFDRVIALDPRAKEAEQAADLILDGLALTGDWEALKAHAKTYRDQPRLGSAAFKGEVATVYENASLKGIEARLASDHDRAAAGRAYLAFYEEFPASKNADLALHNAAVHLREAVGVNEAIAAGEELVKRFPKSRHHADAVAALGFDYESLARFDEAARLYEALAVEAPAHPAAADALYSAAVFRGALGQEEQATRDYQQLLQRWPGRPDAPLVTLEIAQLLERGGRAREAATLYQRFRVAPPEGATVDQVMYARLHEGLLGPSDAPGLWSESLAWYARTGAQAVDHPVAAASAAQMRYLLAEPTFQAFVALEIDGPKERGLSPAQIDRLLQRQLTAKLRGVGEIERRYTQVVETGSGEWGVASLTRVGEAYEDLADTLLSSYVPEYLTDAQKELYQQQLEDLAYAQSERATGAYSLAITRAWALGIYDEHSAMATRRLGELRPDEYPHLFEVLPEARFASSAAVVTPWETE